jgi:hypothetical protein
MGLRSRRGRVDSRRSMVTDMDSEARKIAFAEAKARSIDTLERIADIKVEHRDHDDDALMRWRAGMPKKPPPPTMAEVEHKIADAMADIDGRIVAAVAGYHESEVMRPVTRAVLKALVTEIRTEILTAVGELRADLNIQRAHAAGDVVEVPQFLERRRHA